MLALTATMPLTATAEAGQGLGLLRYSAQRCPSRGMHAHAYSLQKRSKVHRARCLYVCVCVLCRYNAVFMMLLRTRRVELALEEAWVTLSERSKCAPSRRKRMEGSLGKLSMVLLIHGHTQTQAQCLELCES